MQQSSRVKEVLEKQGYFLSSDWTSLLDFGVLRKYCEDTYTSWPAIREEGTSHDMATRVVYELGAQVSEEGVRTDAEDAPKAIENVAKNVLALLPPDFYRCEVIMYNDVGGAEPRQRQEMLDNPDELALFTYTFDRLFWHRDKTERHTDVNSFLFFLVIDCSGCITPESNMLQVGLAPRASFEPRPWPAVSRVWPHLEDSCVGMVGQVPGEAGAGYLINEEFVDEKDCFVVHSHAKFRFATTSFDPAEHPDVVARYFQPGERVTSSNFIGSQSYLVRRIKLIMRIASVKKINEKS
jgi:hypothetical protein